MYVIEEAGAQVKPIKFDDLSVEAMQEWAGGPASGAPWRCFFHDDTLYIDVTCSQQAIAHEAGHVVGWAQEFCPGGFNYGIDANVGSERERIACEVEVFLLTTETKWSQEELIRYHYDVGLIVEHNPDDDSFYHEAHQAWEDFQHAIDKGHTHVSNLLG